MSEKLQRKREIEQSEVRDKLAKVLAGMVPLGSSVYELLTTIVVPLHEKKKREFLSDLADRLKKLEDEGRIDYEELAESEEFNTIITKAILLAQQNHQEEKLEALKNLVLNASEKLLNEAIEFDEVDFFLSVMNSMNSIHIFLIKFLNKPGSSAQEKGIFLTPQKKSELKDVDTEFKKLFFSIHPEFKEKEALVEFSWNELNRMGLAKRISFNSIISDVDYGQSALTELGLKFLEFISIKK